MQTSRVHEPFLGAFWQTFGPAQGAFLQTFGPRGARSQPKGAQGDHLQASAVKKTPPQTPHHHTHPRTPYNARGAASAARTHPPDRSEHMRTGHRPPRQPPAIYNHTGTRGRFFEPMATIRWCFTHGSPQNHVSAPGFARLCPALPGFARLCPALPGFARLCPALPCMPGSPRTARRPREAAERRGHGPDTARKAHIPMGIARVLARNAGNCVKTA